MAFLKNSNGESYKVISSRPSTMRGREDCLVQSKSGGVTIAHGWSSKDKCWVQGTFYGWGEKALEKAKSDFNKSRK